MLSNDAQVIGRLVKVTAIGAAVGASLVWAVIWFDVSSIGTIITASAENALILSLFIGGSMAKGALIGFTCATASIKLKGRVAHRVTAPLLEVLPSRA